MKFFLFNMGRFAPYFRRRYQVRNNVIIKLPKLQHCFYRNTLFGCGISESNEQKKKSLPDIYSVSILKLIINHICF